MISTIHNSKTRKNVYCKNIAVFTEHVVKHCLISKVTKLCLDCLIAAAGPSCHESCSRATL